MRSLASVSKKTIFLSGRKGVVKKKERVRDAESRPRRVRLKEDKEKNETDERTDIMRNNVVQVLTNSTVMPFRWLKSSYRCFYCYDVFQEPKDLKTHQEVHINESKLKCMENYWDSTVHVDVSSISCKLCPKIITEFYDLIDHLITAHDVAFNKDIGICMNPFKLNNISVQCALCGRDYKTFGHLLLHMNEEHKGYSQLLCDVCGRHCRNKNHLREHKKEHINRSVTCTICGETLSSYHKLRPHMQNVHDKKYKCLACPEQFETHYKRSLHMMTVHKSREEVKCQYCPKTFVFRSTMMAHLRVTHLQEKNTICGICGWRTVGKSKLKRHMSKHSNEKNYKCTVCEKAFKTKKNMLLHQRNVHEKEIQQVPHFPEASKEPEWVTKSQMKHQLGQLLRTIIASSTMVPFRWHENKFMCFYCPEKVCGVTEFREHIDSHTNADFKTILDYLNKDRLIKLDVANMWCTQCPVELKTFEDFIDHLNEKHDGGFHKDVTKMFELFSLSAKEMNCLHCDLTFENFVTLLRHTHEIHVHVNAADDRKFLCDLCGRGFTSRGELNTHMNQAHYSKQCSICLKFFETCSALDKHMLATHKIEKNQCPLCLKISPNRTMRRRHMALVHNYKEAQFSCDICHMVFTRHNRLTIHKKQAHFREMNMCCGLCGLLFHNKEDLDKHVANHSNVPAFQCEVCEEKFKTKATLMEHIATHDDDDGDSVDSILDE